MKIISCKLSPTATSSISVIDEKGGTPITKNAMGVNFEDTLFSLISEHNVQRVYFYGPKGYTQGLKKILDKNISTKFNNTVEIICL